jgi:hypothetical protein
MVLKNGVIEFSLNDNLDCENYEIIDVNGNEITTTYDNVENYLNKVIKENINFIPSDHRTVGTIKLMNDFMSISYKSYNRPDWNDFDTVELGIVDIIPLTY